MGFTDAIRTVLSEKYATFAGRAARSEYWWFVLFYFLVMFVLTLALIAAAGLSSFSGASGNEIPVVGWVIFALMGLFLLGMLIPFIAVTVRRLHDRNMSGWWYLGFIVASMIPFVGIIASIALVVITALRGTPGPNKFGADPLAAHNVEVFR